VSNVRVLPLNPSLFCRLNADVHPGVVIPIQVSMIHESFENYLNRCFTGAKARAAKYFVFCYAFLIEGAVGGALLSTERHGTMLVHEVQ
jgi:hypothetical protein